jgi:hypothetical protein
MAEQQAGGGPTVRRMLVGAQLRRHRIDAGLTREQAAEAIRASEWTRSTGSCGNPDLGPQGLRPTPPNASTSAGGPPAASAGSGRHRDTDTTPGSTSSSPSKKPAICSGLRRR